MHVCHKECKIARQLCESFLVVMKGRAGRHQGRAGQHSSSLRSHSSMAQLMMVMLMVKVKKNQRVMPEAWQLFWSKFALPQLWQQWTPQLQNHQVLSLSVESYYLPSMYVQNVGKRFIITAYFPKDLRTHASSPINDWFQDLGLDCQIPCC